MTAVDLHALLDLAVGVSKHAATTLDVSDRKTVQALPRDAKVAADQKLHRLIESELTKNSSFPVLSEEELGKVLIPGSQELMWILDPLDGSVNFSHNIPLCCISIGLWRGMTPVLGVIHDFSRLETFYGLVGDGAWLDGSPIKSSGINQKKDAILCTGFPSGADFSDEVLLKFVADIQSYMKVRLFGSVALSLAYVASGRVDAYKENGIAIWDVAAGLAIVKAAGGFVSFRSTNTQYRFNVTAGVS